MIDIPESKLRQKISQLRRQKAAAQVLLGELESTYAKRTMTDKPGGWRQDPLEWQRRNRPL